jgi:hypothetical protein
VDPTRSGHFEDIFVDLRAAAVAEASSDEEIQVKIRERGKNGGLRLSVTRVMSTI